MSKKYVVTVGECVQISEDEWKFERTSKICSEQTSIAEIMTWAQSLAPRKKWTISDLVFSEVDG